MSILETRGLTKRFGSVQALQGVDLSVAQGEIHGFIGPNGAGKTTTLRVLLGILRRDGGEARLFDRDAWTDAVELHKRIAYVPGDVSLWGNLTGGEVIDLFGRLRRAERSSDRETWIRRFDLDPTKKCRTYSKGNRQKVALVAALCCEADLYILDEPTSGLDPLMEQVFKDCVRELQKRGKTVLLSSHILSEVEQLCDRVSILRQGKVVETGSIAQLRHLTQLRVLIQTQRPLPEDLPGVAKRAGEAGTPRRGEGESTRSVEAGTPRTVESTRPVEAETPRAAGSNRPVEAAPPRASSPSHPNPAAPQILRVDAAQMAAFISAVAPYGVQRLEAAPPTLEELFMNRYEGGAEA